MGVLEWWALTPESPRKKTRKSNKQPPLNSVIYIDGRDGERGKEVVVSWVYMCILRIWDIVMGLINGYLYFVLWGVLNMV